MLIIIIMALPGGICDIIGMLYLTETTFHVTSLMVTIITMGVVTANSILLITFANNQMKHGKTNVEAIEAATLTRLRPMLMTASAMFIGMMRMSLALGASGEQNTPLGKVVIGGLMMAIATTLFFVPVIFTFLRRKPNPYLEEEHDHSVQQKA